MVWTKIAKIFQKYTVILLLILCLPVLLPFFKPGFFPTHDYIYVARVQQLDFSLKSGHFPVRWTPDFRYGEALFNFYAPLPYYVGSLIHTVGVNFLTTTKILFALSFVLSALSMYFFGKDVFGKMAGFVAAVFYLYAPYRSVDVYVRGALSESWAFVFLPLIFLFAYRIYKEQKFRNVVYFSISLACLYYTHNIMTMMMAPFLVLWMGSLVFLSRKIDLIKKYFLGLLLSTGLGLSYLLPAYFEKKYVQTQFLTLGYFDFRAHFVTITQLIKPFWGYGASTWGDGDKISLQIGIVNIFVVICGFVTILFYRKLPKLFKVILPVFLTSFLVSIFMQHNKSAFIWEIFNPMEFIQFPWRFMGVSVFFVSLIAGLIIGVINNQKTRKIIGILLIIVSVLLNIDYFKPESYYLDSVDEHYISKENILYRNDKVPKDYLPIWVKKLVEERMVEPVFSKGEGVISDYQRWATSVKFEADVKQSGFIDVPIYYFPGWQVKVNGKEIPFEEPGELGFIRVKVDEGVNDVLIRFVNTPLRLFSNIVTVFSFGVLVLLFRRRENA